MADVPNTLDAITRNEIDMQVATAQKYPRDLTAFTQRVKQVALADPATAESCYYTLERTDRKTGKKKVIQGVSIRLVEIGITFYKNVRIGARIVGHQGRYVVCQGVAHDVESNVLTTTEAIRPIMTADGRRYSDEMVSVATMAALSIARRNAALAVMPRQFLENVMEDCIKLVGQTITASDSVPDRWARAVTWFGERGVSAAQLLGYLNVSDVQEVTADHIVILSGIRTAVKDDQVSLEEYFPAEASTAEPAEPTAPATPAPSNAAERAREKLKLRRDTMGEEREPGAEG